jgi:hypothetical protein
MNTRRDFVKMAVGVSLAPGSGSSVTPTGTYSISVNADAGTTHVSTQVVLTVQ